MPSLQEIRQFNARLVSLGNEPEVVRGWGEELEDVAEPAGVVDEEISSLLDDADAPAEPDGPYGSDEPYDSGGSREPADRYEPDEPPDFESLLAEGFPDESELRALETAGPPAEPTPTADEEAPDLDEFGAEQELDELPAGAGAELDEGFVPTGLLDGLDLASIEPDAGVEAETGAEEPFDLPDDFSFDDLEADFGSDTDAEPEGAGEPEAPSAAEELGAWDVTLEDAYAADAYAADAYAADAAGDEAVADEAVGTPADGVPADALETFADEPFAMPDGGFELDEVEPAADGFLELEAVDEQDASDDLDTSAFSFDETETGDDDFDMGDLGEPGGGGRREPDETDAGGGLDDVDAGDLDEFSLGDFGAAFGAAEQEVEQESELNPALNIPDVASGADFAAAGQGSFALSNAEFARLQETLGTLPLNLKQEVERIVSEAKGTTGEVEKLCRMLAAGSAPVEIAAYVGRITGKQIRIPRGYERRTGAEFEVERESFAYQFRENILPVLRLAAAAVVVVGLLSTLGYFFVFRPLYARSLYVQGLELIGQDQYRLGNQSFDRAWRTWESPRWYYDYAQAFIGKRQYLLAREKYEELLFGRSAAERDAANELLAEGAWAPLVAAVRPPKRGVLAAAELESAILGNHDRAVRLLQLVLTHDVGDYDARLGLGDTYLRWAEEDPGRFEEARLAYARLIERFGQTDELLFRMLRYFIRTDNPTEVLILKDAFQADPRVRVNPEIYAELAGFLIDHSLTDDVEEIAFRALEVDSGLPEPHYELARLYRLIGARGEEELALATARRLLSEADVITPRRHGMLIDATIRIGENQLAAGFVLEAQESFADAIRRYEEAMRRRILGPSPVYARAYARMGDILFYEARQYEAALEQFIRAEQSGFREPDLDYKQGFVYYRMGEFERARTEFTQAAADPLGVTNALLWATANTHFRRGNLFAAEAYYRSLLDRVERRRASIRTLLVDEDSEHRSVIEYLIRGYNNLGVTLYRLWEQSGEPSRFSQSLVYLTDSTELAVNYRRDPQTLSRAGVVNLGYLNQRFALYPTPDYELQIYAAIPEDLDALLF